MRQSGIAGKIAVVTGAGGGIGAAVVRLLAQEGARVVATDIAAEGVAALLAGKASVVAGAARNKVQAEVGTHLPDAVAGKVAAKQTEPGSGS